MTAVCSPDVSFDPPLYAEMVWCEGYETKLYMDSRGNITGGIGWNFTANGLPGWVIKGLYNQAIYDALQALKAYPCFSTLDPVRSRAVINLMFNMGPTVFAEFKSFVNYMSSGQWSLAAQELKTSDWYSEVGKRGPMIISMIETGKDPVL
jgi:GH24 family phage-related lysozyme (muramidase)